MFVAVGGCLGEADRVNPLDPLADDFTGAEVRGAVTSFYQPFTGIEGVEVRLQPGDLTGRSGADGSFLIDGVPPGDYMLSASKPAFAAVPESVTVDSGVEDGISLRLDALPQAVGMSVRSVHIARWWPETDLYMLNISATVDDGDGVSDVASVWAELADFAYSDTLQTSGEPGVFVASIEEDMLPVQRINTLVGRVVELFASDRAGFSNSLGGVVLARVIEEVPVASSPQGLETVQGPDPLLRWDAIQLPFPFTYRVDIVRVEANIQTLVEKLEGIDASRTSARPTTLLDAGDYFWTVSVVDEFGNRSRSREAGFRVP